MPVIYIENRTIVSARRYIFQAHSKCSQFQPDITPVRYKKCPDGRERLDSRATMRCRDVRGTRRGGGGVI